MDAVCQSASDRGGSMEGAQDRDGRDRGPGEGRSDVVGDPRETDDLDVHLLSRRLETLELRPAPVLQAERQSAPGHRLLERVRVDGDLVAHSGSNQVAAVRIEAFLDEEGD